MAETSTVKSELRLPKELNDALKKWAKENHFSKNTAIIVILEKALKDAK